VVNLSHSDLSLEHVKHLAAWLQVPGRNLRLFALDLSFNRIESPTWAAFVPVVTWLRPYVAHMDFGGNCLPAIIEIDLLKEPPLQCVSLSLALNQLSQVDWVNRWDKQAREFRALAYGCPLDDPRCCFTLCRAFETLCKVQLRHKLAVCCRYGVGTACYNLTV